MKLCCCIPRQEVGDTCVIVLGETEMQTVVDLGDRDLFVGTPRDVRTVGIGSHDNIGVVEICVEFLIRP